METNVSQSFSDKWTKNELLAWDQTLTPNTDTQTWILGRNGFSSLSDLRRHLQGKARILDAGCGNGRVTALLRSVTDPSRSELVAVDLVAHDVAKRNLQHLENIRVGQADLLGDLYDLGEFDFIYCQEVLHHTSNPRAAFLNLASRLRANGEIAIYVYKKKAPAREFVDDFVREKIAALPYEKAMESCRQITDLGKALSDLRINFEAPEVKVLGIPAGTYDLQRFLYHFFLKCYWNPELGFEGSSVVNYDWYHPELASRHELDEVRAWFSEAGLKVVHECVDFYGITVRGVKQGDDHVDTPR